MHICMFLLSSRYLLPFSYKIYANVDLSKTHTLTIMQHTPSESTVVGEEEWAQHRISISAILESSSDRNTRFMWLKKKNHGSISALFLVMNINICLFQTDPQQLQIFLNEFFKIHLQSQLFWISSEAIKKKTSWHFRWYFFPSKIIINNTNYEQIIQLLSAWFNL